jgi:hypothetical protein
MAVGQAGRRRQRQVDRVGKWLGLDAPSATLDDGLVRLGAPPIGVPAHATPLEARSHDSTITHGERLTRR